MNKKKILVLGAGGMLGHMLFSKLSGSEDMDVYGTVRNKDKIVGLLDVALCSRVIENVDANDFASIQRTISEIKPDITINCIGIIKQLPGSNDPVTAIGINSLLPHKIAGICAGAGCRLIHFSTDCVFDGKKGNYSEADAPTAADLYGRTKFLGEVAGQNCLTIRTSIIGHELGTHYGLIEWFLAQKKTVSGYRKAIFSGFPTVEIARILSEYVIPDGGLNGLCQVSSEPISKFDLLKLVAKVYGKDIEIVPSDAVDENRSLDSDRFRRITGYKPPEWETLIEDMRENYINSPCYNEK